MAAIFVRLLLVACACVVLLVTSCVAQRRSSNLVNCDELLLGDMSSNVVYLDSWLSDPYDNIVNITNYDHCSYNHQKLVGVLIHVCDPFGPPAPSLFYFSAEEQIAECHTGGPCPAGLVVTVTQYCEVFETQKPL